MKRFNWGIALFLALLVSYAPISSGAPSSSAESYQKWKVRDMEDIIFAWTHGHITHGNRFGFIKKRGSCNISILYLTIATANKIERKWTGQSGHLRFSIGDTSFIADVAIKNIR